MAALQQLFYHIQPPLDRMLGETMLPNASAYDQVRLVQSIQCKVFSAKYLVQNPKDRVIPCFSAKYTVERIGELVQILRLNSFSANSFISIYFSAKSTCKLKCI